jgi:hypothetical protein
MTVIHKMIMAAAATALAACSSIDVKRADHGAPDLPDGLVYYLPAKQFNVSVAFELQDCLVDAGKPVIPYTTSAVVTESLVADLSQVHYIRYGELSAKTKVVGFNVQLYDNGTLKSVNAKAEDRSGQIITSVAEAAGSLARGLAMGRFYSANAKEQSELCAPEFLKLLAARANAQNRLAEDRQADKARKAKGTQVAAAALGFAQAKVKVAELAKTGTTKEKEDAARALAVAEEVLNGLKTEQADLGESQADKIAADLAAARAALTETVVLAWQPSLSETTTTIAYPEASFGKLLLKEKDKANKIAAQVVLQLLGGAKANVGAIGTATNSTKGIVYRQPVTARLSICPGDCVTGGAVRNPILSQTYLLPQMGALGALPLKNEIFDKNSLVLAQTSDGTLVSLQFDSEASLEKAAETAKTASAKYMETVGNLIKDRRTERSAQREDRSKEREERTEARDEAVALRKEEADSLKAAGDRIELLREVELKRSGELDKVQREIDRTDKERKLLEAQIELAKKRKELAKELTQ